MMASIEDEVNNDLLKIAWMPVMFPTLKKKYSIKLFLKVSKTANLQLRLSLPTLECSSSDRMKLFTVFFIK